MKTPRSRFLVLLLVWGLAATVAGVVHLLAHLPPGAVPVLIAGMTIGLTLVVARVAWVGEAARSLGVRTIIAAHLVRFAGFYFLWLYTEGRLPAEFAHRAGWGDVVAAAGALVLVLGPERWRHGWTLTAWNIVGAFDLLLAVGTAGWLNATRPGSMIEMASLPLTLVPLWLVPVLLASHFTLLRWSLRGKTPEAFSAGGAMLPG